MRSLQLLFAVRRSCLSKWSLVDTTPPLARVLAHTLTHSLTHTRSHTHVQNMDTDKYFPIPKIELFLSDLAELCRSPYMADAGLSGMRDDLVLHGTAALIIKPAKDGCSTGVMRIQEPEHLLTYALAVSQEWEEIPRELTDGKGPLFIC
jgi:hypothetical protein